MKQIDVATHLRCLEFRLRYMAERLDGRCLSTIFLDLRGQLDCSILSLAYLELSDKRL